MEGGTFVSQSKYAKNLVKKFGLESAKQVSSPMSTTLKLTKDEHRVKVDTTLYRSVIGSLLYLTASHPDINYSVGVCAQYQNTNSNLACFSDADWSGNADDRKSTSGGQACPLTGTIFQPSKYFDGDYPKYPKASVGATAAAGASSSSAPADVQEVKQ
ncbi:uncharacterized mitochondrial protein AtMg00810-like [Cannabis sativa]|uniref:uncharacterized mitochondrial protein AtMg00810-like n=1 Tax=Cannabis sativa TaxID=3483 RepID=UPI0029C9F76D|nr:uncharacterized mitochondrial protein AtMg00810-like [Cannabis sativa]